MSHPYAGEAYARSLAHIGAPFAVPEWGGHVLARATPCGTREDAVGPYPLTVLGCDADIAAGLTRLKAADLVSVVLVLDDRLRPAMTVLESAPVTVRQFKPHYVHDRSLGPVSYGKHHRYELRRALARTEVSEISLADHLPDWERLYGALMARHGLGGLHGFPPVHHETLAGLASLRTFGAFIDGRLVSAHLFVTHDGHAMSHLAASAAEGYQSGAAYAVNDLALTELTDCAVINFGGGAGMGDDPADGLVRFKKGFSNSVEPSYLFTAILDGDAYTALSAGSADSGFFPAYRGPRPQERSDEHQG
ncbi:hypothetical protein [uncultured Brevundimonas sp.]|uniref:hypothetical protein n=1 Tax=uncultured Brevundimonas sp. TaxID=213418 RepID=UPI0030EE9759|tara:strand:+ start:149857 stop:150774 length:918 start_codon:yes stop_codon:yes gene_type:complete